MFFLFYIAPSETVSFQAAIQFLGAKTNIDELFGIAQNDDEGRDKQKEERWSPLSYLHLNIYKIVVFGLIIDSLLSASWTFNSIYLLISLFSISLYWTLGWSDFICTVARAWFTFGLVLLFPFHTSILEPVQARDFKERAININWLLIRQQRRIKWIHYHILIWRSVRQSACAISMRLRRVK